MKLKSLLMIMLATLAVLLVSCNNNNTEIEGDWDDNIHLSTRYASFDNNEGSATVTTENGWWWFNEVNINGEHYIPEYQTNMFDKEYITIVADWLTVDRVESKKIRLAVKPNLSGSDRTAYVHVQAGNYFDHITVTQTKNGELKSDQ